MSSKPPSPDIRLWKMSLHLGLRLATPVVIGVIGGIKLDKAFQTLPFFTITGMGIAFATSCYFVYKLITDSDNLTK